MGEEILHLLWKFLTFVSCALALTAIQTECSRGQHQVAIRGAAI